jgi:DNA recombination protein RmuC
MEWTSIFVAACAGAVASGLFLWMYFKAQLRRFSDDLKCSEDEHRQAQIDLQLAREKSAGQSEELNGLRTELSDEREKVIHLNRQLSGVESDHRNLKQRLDEQKAEVEKLQERFTLEFKNLANEILEEKSRKFTDQNKTNLGELLNPLKEKIAEFEKKVEQTNKESLERNTALREQITNLRDLNLLITKEAENLTKALKGESKTQGNWGEMQLETILNRVGLEKGLHYEKEKVYQNEEGHNQRLDYIIRLPDDKFLILDSKVSLTAYANYFNAEDDIQRARFLKMHLDSVQSHIKLLSEKNYHSLYEIQQPDYVLMFVANEPALTIALKEDMSLYEKALDKSIVLVSTSTLLATLRTISYIWKQDMQGKNALEIARQAGALYDKFTAFTDDLIKVGKNLDATQSCYKEAVKKLYDGKDNLIRKTERLRELGAKTTKSIDTRLLDRAAQEE